MRTPPATPAAAAGHAAGGGGDAADGAAGVAVTPKKKGKKSKRQSGPHTPTQSRSLRTPPVTPVAAAGHAAGGGGELVPSRPAAVAGAHALPVFAGFVAGGSNGNMSLQEHYAILQAQFPLVLLPARQSHGAAAAIGLAPSPPTPRRVRSPAPEGATKKQRA